MFEVPYFPLPYLMLPAGAYDLHFGFDKAPDGNLTLDSLNFETVRPTVQ